MKKKLICTLLVFALVLCVTPIAFPGVGNSLVAFASTCVGDISPSKEPTSIDYHLKWFVWVERDRDEAGQRNDKIVMELIPVEQDEQEDYLRKFQDTTGWEDEDVSLYAPAGGFFTGQVHARLADFEKEHAYGGSSTVEIGLIDEGYNAPTGAVYYEHKAFEESDVNYALVLRVGELRIEVSADYTKSDFNFAARPDGSGGWEIVLKDADGNDIEYTVVE